MDPPPPWYHPLISAESPRFDPALDADWNRDLFRPTHHHYAPPPPPPPPTINFIPPYAAAPSLPVLPAWEEQPLRAVDWDAVGLSFPTLAESPSKRPRMVFEPDGSRWDGWNQPVWAPDYADLGPASSSSPAPPFIEHLRTREEPRRRPVRERLSRPPPPPRRTPLKPWPPAKFKGSGKKRWNEQSIFNAPPGAVKFSGTPLVDRSPETQRPVKRDAPEPGKGNAAVVKLEVNCDASSPAQTGSAKKARRLKKKVSASPNSLNIKVSNAVLKAGKDEGPSALGKVSGLNGVKNRVEQQIVDCLNDLVSSLNPVSSKHPNVNDAAGSKLQEMKMDAANGSGPTVSSRKGKGKIPRDDSIKGKEEAEGLLSKTVGLEEDLDMDSKSKVSLDFGDVQAVMKNEYGDKDGSSVEVDDRIGGPGGMDSSVVRDTVKDLGNKVGGISTLLESKICRSDIEDRSKVVEYVGSTRGLGKDLLDVDTREGLLATCSREGLLRDETDSKIEDQIEFNRMKVKISDEQRAVIGLAEKNKLDGLTPVVEDIISDSWVIPDGFHIEHRDSVAREEQLNRGVKGNIFGPVVSEDELQVSTTILNKEKNIPEVRNPGDEVGTCSPDVGKDQSLSTGYKIEDREVTGSSENEKEVANQCMKKNHLIAVKFPQISKQAPVDTLVGKTYMSSGTRTAFSTRITVPSRAVKQKASTSLSHVTKRARTWHRTVNKNSTSLPVQESSMNLASLRKESPRKNLRQLTSSYVRKGHSLVRKAPPVTTVRLASPTLLPIRGEEKQHGMGSETGHNPVERPKTPPLLTAKSVCIDKGTEVTNLASCPTKSSNTSSVDQVAVSNEKEKLIYVKRKSNQLVAASKHEVPEPMKERGQELPCALTEGYYKKKKNQIVRNTKSSKTMSDQEFASLDDNSSSDKPKVVPDIPLLKYNRSLSKQKLEKVWKKMFRPSKSSLVWTLAANSQSEDKNLRCQEVLPCLFPWKRMPYSRCYMGARIVHSDKRSLSLISRKLLSSRKKETIYTRSTSGFSLRRSSVLSVNGRSLKWSKSIERRSKKANKEATLAVAALEKKKRVQKGVPPVSIAKNGGCSSHKAHCVNLLPGERIFRVGSVRYKMDASKRTLVRIPDEKSSCTIDIKGGKDSTRSFVPKRLLIGHNEYVRVGNGNKLVRDPKKLKHMLASEKVRWSLHTARLKLAKKQQYCQFFTKFGKCNKGDGKCPYIHDPSKIAVCTKFIRGLCLAGNCKLTHKVIPERMPDCSYFLRGLCANENCPYRHVKVNSSAPVCEGFLKGYCVDGDECRKRHTYVCPLFEEKGMCPLASSCKLHHPKTRNKCMGQKCAKKQKNAKGRYFGSSKLNDGGENKALTSQYQAADTCGGDVFFNNGCYSDYISLDICEEECHQSDDLIGEESLAESDPPETEIDDPHDHIRPIGLMRREQCKSN